MDDATNKSLQKNERVVPESEVREMRKRIQELERLAGKQAMKIEILEEAVKIGREKSGYLSTACPPRAVESETDSRSPRSKPPAFVNE